MKPIIRRNDLIGEEKTSCYPERLVQVGMSDVVMGVNICKI